MPLPVFGAAIGGIAVVLAKYLVPYIITRVVISLGLTLLTFVGVDLLTDYIVSQVRGASGNIGADLVSILALAGAFDWLEIVLAALVASANIRSLRGTFKSLSFLVGS
ncbi:DUF2523 domain-containing protein [Microbulbifer sp. OS29]|uniref:DUF2523 domain-containing protein n=1 Tax=Microbulbifer okhotskensis TaxID=2926617 RepID=A0A9X2J7T4_9GAMM|nr:DUF2523 family protein [Microbulbifer okhotskensis]MCO1336120.1 DUF2523 domain-containing protein [Microbulbifer okhotskensis]